MRAPELGVSSLLLYIFVFCYVPVASHDPDAEKVRRHRRETIGTMRRPMMMMMTMTATETTSSSISPESRKSSKSLKKKFAKSGKDRMMKRTHHMRSKGKGSSGKGKSGASSKGKGKSSMVLMMKRRHHMRSSPPTKGKGMESASIMSTKGKVYSSSMSSTSMMPDKGKGKGKGKRTDKDKDGKPAKRKRVGEHTKAPTEPPTVAPTVASTGQPESISIFPRTSPAVLPGWTGPAAVSWGDPHVVTYDRLGYDCQGRGDYILAKAVDDSLEVQGRFASTPTYPGVSVSTAVAAYVQGIGNVEVYSTSVHTTGSAVVGTCPLSMYFNGEPIDPYFGLSSSNLVVDILDEKVDIYFRSSALVLTIVAIPWLDNGCLLNTFVGVPEKVPVLGLLGGTPNGIVDDDWRITHNAFLELPTTLRGLLGEEAYNYCTQQWCVRDRMASLFTIDDELTLEETCDLPFPGVIKPLSAPDSIFEICGIDYPACLIDGIIRGSDGAQGAVEVATQLDDLDSRPATQQTAQPSSRPTTSPSSKPTNGNLTSSPTAQPSSAPSSLPTRQPSSVPTRFPTNRPTGSPTRSPSRTSVPTAVTSQPTQSPTQAPTQRPTVEPTRSPSVTAGPTAFTFQPTRTPSSTPTFVPTNSPTTPLPTTLSPSTQEPTSPSPSTQEPETFSPSTQAPTSPSPSTQEPTTLSPSTQAPTSPSPTTQAPTSSSPTTPSPTTLEPTMDDGFLDFGDEYFSPPLGSTGSIISGKIARTLGSTSCDRDFEVYPGSITTEERYYEEIGPFRNPSSDCACVTVNFDRGNCVDGSTTLVHATAFTEFVPSDVQEDLLNNYLGDIRETDAVFTFEFSVPGDTTFYIVGQQFLPINDDDENGTGCVFSVNVTINFNEGCGARR